MKKVDINDIQGRGKFAVILKCLLMKKRISQGQLASAVGLSQATVSHYIKGQNTPSQRTIEKIAEYLEVSPNAFYEDIDEYTPYLNMFSNFFSSRLYGLIKESGLTCESFAKKIGVSRQTVSNYINEKQMPTASVAKKIAEYFHISIDSLINSYDAVESSDMKLYVTKVPASPEECIFCTEKRYDGERIMYCRLCNEECKMTLGVCPYIEKKH